MNINREHVEFHHNGKELTARLDIYSRKGIEYGYVINFSYKDINVSVTFDNDETTYWHVAKRECEIIDEVGEQKYKKYDQYRSKINSIEKDYIIAGNNVYSYYLNDELRSGENIYYLMGIKMADGTSLDGSSPSKFFYEEDRKNKKRTFENL
ncbi:hypothetical protein [Fictibacillus phosphorivorans]|uniref:hypothetical protein n=1 Tax=Fictibacillus phosphorivorans TaxID=1221500 RepID=UPI00203CEE51|nr:hypothetical protein [Fictibacillus phosphorivorans]MCM3719178.1 hypothetical protein [Fictibacillus phosphorivorans]MCM3776800.1 hypothetical protein [Fictibacillus phosphorivorans]